MKAPWISNQAQSSNQQFRARKESRTEEAATMSIWKLSEQRRQRVDDLVGLPIGEEQAGGVGTDAAMDTREGIS
jgi:hypothetical protein